MIESRNIILRHAVMSDLPRYAPLFNRVILKGAHEIPVLQAPSTMERQLHLNGMVDERTETLLIVDWNDQLLGTIWNFKAVPTYNSREIGYIVYPLERRNTGIATEAVRMLSDHLFKRELINRLEIRMSVDNIASERVAIKSGYTKEGISRQAKFIQGRHVDMLEYALLRSEWEQWPKELVR